MTPWETWESIPWEVKLFWLFILLGTAGIWWRTKDDDQS